MRPDSRAWRGPKTPEPGSDLPGSMFRDGTTHCGETGMNKATASTIETSSNIVACPRWDSRWRRPAGTAPYRAPLRGASLHPHNLAVACFADRCVYQFRHGGTLAVRWREPDCCTARLHSLTDRGQSTPTVSTNRQRDRRCGSLGEMPGRCSRTELNLAATLDVLGLESERLEDSLVR